MLFSFTSNFKRLIVSRMYWGRSSLYKNISHFLVVFITILFAISGLIYRVADVSASQTKLEGNVNIGSDDLLQQGGSVATVLRIDDNNLSGIDTSKYTVKPNDTLASIATSYKVTIDTVRWANPGLISPFSNEIQNGWVLTIPQINGVLYTVKKGQTLDDIIKITSVNNNESNKFNIVQFNKLNEPYTLVAGQKLFIPDGNLSKQEIEVEGIPRGVFIDPLSDPSCKGYNYSRGFTSYHDGVDLPKSGGCIIVAAATGTVVFAGWENLSGYAVKIDHGGGIGTLYYHNSEIYVKVGDRVQQGDPISYMGNTGNSFGTHLHFILRKNHNPVDPAEYVPYKRVGNEALF